LHSNTADTDGSSHNVVNLLEDASQESSLVHSKKIDDGVEIEVASKNLRCNHPPTLPMYVFEVCILKIGIPSCNQQPQQQQQQQQHEKRSNTLLATTTNKTKYTTSSSRSFIDHWQSHSLQDF
jgi:hypothetical protein